MLHLELVSQYYIIIRIYNQNTIAEMFVPYTVLVTPAGSNSSRIIDCFTEEGGT